MKRNRSRLKCSPTYWNDSQGTGSFERRDGVRRAPGSPKTIFILPWSALDFHIVERLAAVLINCVAYKNGRKLADIPVGEIHLYIQEPDCFVWVALADPEPAELEAMQKEFGLHELAIEMPATGINGPRSKNTANAYSWCCR